MSVSELDALEGLESAKRVLRGLFGRQSGIHAVLLYGSEGSRQGEVARLLAQTWLCTQPTEAGACAECPSCNAFGRGRAADYLFIEPKPPSRIIRLSAIRPMERSGKDEEDLLPVDTFLRTPPLQARHKVVLIEDADRMNGDASNALLKMLEEPHPYAKFILTTNAISRMLPTILSRCVSVVCELPAANEGVDAGKILFGEGIGGREDLWTQLCDFAGNLKRLKAGGALRASEDFAKIAERVQETLQIGARAAQADALHVLAYQVSRQHPDRAAWSQMCIEAHRRINGNANPTLVFDALFAEMAAVR